MDCTDIIVGMARGNLNRVFDAYTRDRSTPMEDSIYGGSDSISGAAASETDGVTTVMFRKPLAECEINLSYLCLQFFVVYLPNRFL